MELLDSRRLTGPNLLLDRAGAVGELRVAASEVEVWVAAWARQARRLLDAVGWGGEELASRRFGSGVSLALTAPLDGLYAATELNEAALELAAAELAGREGPGFAAEVARLAAAIAAEADPALGALAAAAAARGVSFLADDELATVGTGRGSATWPIGDLPAPADVPWEAVFDVPAALVTGTNGKSTTVRLLAAIAAAAGRAAGTTSTDGITVGGRWLERDDLAGPSGARALLRDRRVDLAVLETARGGILRRGLAIRRATAAAVTNVAADHLGDYGVETLADLAAAKLVVARAVAPGGRLVVNADDPLLAPAAAVLPVPRLWFSLDAASPRLAPHLAAGGDACFLDGGELILARGADRQAVAAVDRIPVAYGGAARYNVANALAAVGLAAALGLPTGAIAAGLADLASDPTDNPGRANLFSVRGALVMVDYAHNPHGVAALVRFAGRLAQEQGCRRRLLTLGQAGDRSDDDIRELARAALALAPDRVIVKELAAMLRGRAPGEVPALLEAELCHLGLPAERLGRASSDLDAARRALAWAEPGDLLVLLVHQERDAVLALLGEAAGAPPASPET